MCNRFILKNNNDIIIITDGEILKISQGLTSAVARYVMFMSSTIIARKKQIFGKLPQMY